MIINVQSPAPRELVLIVDPEAGLRIGEDKVTSIKEGVDYTPLEELISSGQISIEPLYGISEDTLKKRAPKTAARMGFNQPLDLSIFYHVTARDDKMLEPMAASLRELRFVQAAYIKPGPELPFIDREPMPAEMRRARLNSSDFTDHQGYLNAAEAGIDARFAWDLNGGRGEGVNVIDIEGAWHVTHEDLRENPSQVVCGVSVSHLQWRKHGTAVLGMLGGDHNGIGIMGICPKANISAISIFGNDDGTPRRGWNSAAAIRCAADMLNPGDIMLLELHQPGPAAGFQENDSNTVGYIPVEWWPCNLAAIQYATSRDIIVVEAGGNGGQNLDDDIYDSDPGAPNGPFPSWWRNPFKRNPIDSGAIVVGGGLPPGSSNPLKPDRSRWELSNFGKMMDTQGWSDNVATSGGNNDLNLGAAEDSWYTARFNGTSSAAAMVAGALCCLQGILRAQGENLGPARARELLSRDDLGSPQQPRLFYPVSQRIGPRPNLRNLITHLLP